mmetsp:Transcript_7623/g.9125  ORF Transcript_7623/g.9125 Transcript_7623/m.9125 type:complete len:341 (-) Transcript_7623:1120-2142(-)|eukprot:CAMPEP_0195256406 /NCGR_PEP_ID=MMETSP0706-20130129/6215_1 /TAXON_ID=33640 /ORGANISM="Asterionellopsis glacialis, Strain CCMP134" /LENGTH=340 /DNA_ID=CAMNT_0040309439 /DNA_START=6 /DNA_END=1028 /DNA_ORIENTATION=-
MTNSIKKMPSQPLENHDNHDSTYEPKQKAEMSQISQKNIEVPDESLSSLSPQTHLCLPSPSTWPHYPLIIVPNKTKTSSSSSTTAPSPTNFTSPLSFAGTDALPLGIPFEIDSEIFHGSVLIRISGSNSDNPKQDQAYFKDRKRKWQVVVQGMFKEEIAVADLKGMAEFERPLKHVPPKFMVSTISKILQVVSPGIHVDMTSNVPHIEACLGSIPQTIRADNPGQEPDMVHENHIHEDCSAFGGPFESGNIGTFQRKRLLSNPSYGFTFDTQKMYTFEYYDHFLDLPKCELKFLGVSCLDIAKLHDGQPFTATVKTSDDRHLFSLCIWHKRFLEVLEQHK